MTLLGLPLIVALVVVALLTAGGMAVRSVSRIWLRHWAERQLRGSGAAVDVSRAAASPAHRGERGHWR